MTEQAYEALQMEIIPFDSKDVITESVGGSDEGDV